MTDDGEALSSGSESPHNRELDESTKAERDIPFSRPRFSGVRALSPSSQS